MSEIINNQKVFSLLEVMSSIQRALTSHYKGSYWIKAEMIKVNRYKYSGHAYPELVEKKDGKVVAQVKGTLWSSRFEEINSRFIHVTKEPLKDGVNIMLRAQVNFDPVHGLSLNILDIDPSFTLGDLEREKQETIKKLRKEDAYDRNKKLSLPLLPQRIAIISVETSKGFSDFINVIDTNSWGYKFFHMLFPSLLQGDLAVDAIMNQLQRIKKVIHHFDIVAIIRGGGGDVGLSCYNDYNLSKEIAAFPLPVFTGIGHSTNETVVEMISHTNSITPTKLAEFLIQKFHNFNVPVQESERIVSEFAIRILEEKSKGLSETTKYFQSVTQGQVMLNKSSLDDFKHRLVRQSEHRLSASNRQLEFTGNILASISKEWVQKEKVLFQSTLSGMDRSTRNRTQKAKLALSELGNILKISPANILKGNTDLVKNELRVLGSGINRIINQKRSKLEDKEQQVELLDPVNVLERGYSITYLNGKALHQSTDVKQGDLLETRLYNGKMESVVRTTNLTKWKKRNRTQKPSKSFKK